MANCKPRNRMMGPNLSGLEATRSFLIETYHESRIPWSTRRGFRAHRCKAQQFGCGPHSQVFTLQRDSRFFQEKAGDCFTTSHPEDSFLARRLTQLSKQICGEERCGKPAKLVRRYLPPGKYTDLYQLYASHQISTQLLSLAARPSSTHFTPQAGPRYYGTHCAMCGMS